MYELTCNWYTVGLVIYGVLIASCIFFEILATKRKNYAFVYLAGWGITLTDFIWGIINCFVQKTLPIGMFIIFCGIITLFNNVRYCSDFLED